MNITKLFQMQQQLDKHIQQKHELQNERLIERKLLALLVEMGELANETRCFKFWSLKPSSEKKIILEEFVDGVHFILSLGIENGYTTIQTLPTMQQQETMTGQFLQVFKEAMNFQEEMSKDKYVQLFASYITLGEMLGFEAEEIEEAYVSKNEVNFKRQEQGY
ncbi:dUTP diphosphatase [Metabacillus iocasae]|uniref:Dimeric dUTPase (All-alpha-NTP-PPase superfamily) n=1 Tax=Priestia iocasae TaxID=2291674 RepID=A0ABS2QP79_9BACI|nr:dUTP diphosphatase [Metabacillus iocasae]MBM7701260.1 dimeric dUTPase (all-alpha-NTP-PPase superfamily) [Metabacillus iocasae]